MQGPRPLEVDKGKAEAPPQVIGPTPGVMAPASAKETDLGRDIVYIKESPGIWFKKGKAYYKSKAFFAIIIAPLILLSSLYVIQRRRSRFKSDAVYAGRIMAFKASRKGIKELNAQLKTADPKSFYQVLFDTLQKYLGYRLNIPPAGVTAGTAVEGLERRDIDPAIISKVRKLFEACDMARFAFLEVDDAKMRDDRRELEDILTYFERKRL
jgi:hypothetical protein